MFTVQIYMQMPDVNKVHCFLEITYRLTGRPNKCIDLYWNNWDGPDFQVEFPESNLP